MLFTEIPISQIPGSKIKTLLKAQHYLIYTLTLMEDHVTSA